MFGDRDFGESSINAKETTNNGGNDAGEAHNCNESDDELIIVYEYYEIEHTVSHGSIDSDIDIPHYMPNQRPVSEPPIFNYEHFIDDEVPSDKRLEPYFSGVETSVYEQILELTTQSSGSYISSKFGLRIWRVMNKWMPNKHSFSKPFTKRYILMLKS